MRIFCSICKDIFIPYSEIHATNCGHLYHGSCITTWVKQHKTCPQCRAKTSQSFRIYFDVEKDRADPSTLEHELETLSDKLREVERQKQNLQDEFNEAKNVMEHLKEHALTVSKQNNALQASVTAFKAQISKLTKQNESVQKLEKEVATCNSKIQTLQRLETIIKGSVEEVNKLIESTPFSELAIRQLCTYVGVLKSQLHKTEEKNSKLLKENRNVLKLLSNVTVDSSENEKIKNLEQANSKLLKDLQRMKALYEESLNKERTKKEREISMQITTQVKRKTFFHDFDIDLDDESVKNPEPVSAEREDKTISNWEKLISDGPSRSGSLYIKSKSFSKPSSKDDHSSQRSSSYAFDGMGGTKKVRLGQPTPREEMEEIIKKRHKKSVKENRPNKSIVDYFEIE